MPGKDGTPAPPRKRTPPRYRRPAAELVARAARRIVRGARASYSSQTEFLSALLAVLREQDPLAALGGARLRRLMMEVPGVRVSVRYAERPGRPTPGACPVCAGALVPIRNRTLSGSTVVLGQHCARCDYWTHGVARVPVRYAFTHISGRKNAAPTAGRRDHGPRGGG